MRRTFLAGAAIVLVAASCGGDDVVSTSVVRDAFQASEPTEVPGGIDTTLASAVADQVIGADGVTSAVADTSRIVALSGDLTEVVFELGLGSSVVAVDVTTVEPAPARSLPIVGVGRFLSAEAVLAQQPTLVVGDTQTAPPEAIAQIRSAGVPVVIFEVPTSFDGLYRKLASIGEALGVPAAGAALADRVRSEVESALAGLGTIDPAPGVAFVYSRGPDVMLLFGAEMTTQPLIEAVGAVDVGSAAGVTGTVAVTPEALIVAAPDVIITTSEGLAALGGIEGLLAIPGVAETPAGRTRSILDYPEGDFLTFGPRIADSLSLLGTDLAALLAAP